MQDENQVLTLDSYSFSRPIATRWQDNDVYAHVNNVVYYSWFDTVVNSWLIRQGLLDDQSPEICLVVETGCKYHHALTFPETITAAIRVAKIGTSSVVYAIGIFGEGRNDPAATGRFVHVCVDRQTRRPVPLPQHWRDALVTLC